MEANKGHKNLEKRKPFTKNDPRINLAGRPPRLLSVVTDELKKEGFTPVTPAQIKEAYEVLLNLPTSKVMLIAGKKLILNAEVYRDNPNSTEPVQLSSDEADYPYFYRLIASAILGKNSFEVAEKIISRAQGTPKQSIEHTGDLSFKINIVPKEKIQNTPETTDNAGN